MAESRVQEFHEMDIGDLCEVGPGFGTAATKNSGYPPFPHNQAIYRVYALLLFSDAKYSLWK